MSAARARANPPPAAGPLTAAITGGVRARSRRTRSERRDCPLSVAATGCRRPAAKSAPRAAFMSKPAQNPRPAPVRTTAWQSASWATSSRAACRCSTSESSMALSRSGRLRVIRRTLSPDRETRTGSVEPPDVGTSEAHRPADDLLHDLARAAVEPLHAPVAPQPGDLVLVDVAVTAVQLGSGPAPPTRSR